jgi:hypothetical protein
MQNGNVEFRGRKLASLKNNLRQQILSQQSLVPHALRYNNAVRSPPCKIRWPKRISSPTTSPRHDQATEMKQRGHRAETARHSDVRARQIELNKVRSVCAGFSPNKSAALAMRVTSPKRVSSEPRKSAARARQYVSAGSLLARVVQPGKL